MQTNKHSFRPVDVLFSLQLQMSNKIEWSQMTLEMKMLESCPYYLNDFFFYYYYYYILLQQYNQ